MQEPRDSMVNCALLALILPTPATAEVGESVASWRNIIGPYGKTAVGKAEWNVEQGPATGHIV